MYQRCTQEEASLPLSPPGGTSGKTSDVRSAFRKTRGRRRGGPRAVVVLMVLLSLPGLAGAQDLRWQDAVATLAAERTRAETCVRLLKRHAGSDPAAVSRGDQAYSTAKAEVDGVLAGLHVVLAQGGTPPSLTDLEARMTRGVQGREAFCQQVLTRIPEDPGTKNVLVQLAGSFVEPLVKAVGALWQGQREQDRLLRQTIQTQLEATQWAKFADIQP
jgi:hypothetical protein